MIDYGRALGRSSAVANAARVAAQYGSGSVSRNADTAGNPVGRNRFRPAFHGSHGYAGASPPMLRGGALSCGGSCGAGKMLMYIQVPVTANASAIFSYPGLPYTGNIEAQATMRVQ